ncbi:ATP-binding protein [Marimonas sp. MJW-29]|uniref:histidine kinase n=1 Tax=Sulfitobacter sediminis TaxID=3234186 RepID=A0ABV3RJT0_9RHOB
MKTQGAAVIAGGLLSGGWYLSAQALLSGTAAQIVPAAGAIALASITPLLLSKKATVKSISSENLSLSQRLIALDRHVMVNVVDSNNLLTEVNDQMVEITGYAREELIGKPVKMLYSDNDGHMLANQIRNHLVRGETWQGETPLRRADGRIIVTHTTVIPLFDEKGGWVGSISARTDITRMNKLMAEHETVEALDELRDDIWILDANTFRFTYMNKTALRRAGWSDLDISGKGIEDIRHLEHAQAILDACESLRESDESIGCVETELDGTPFYVTIKFLRVGNHADRFLILLNDMSERLLEERQKSDFISMVSHELRSPLTSIKGSMGLLLSKAAGELPDRALSLLEIAHRNADRLVLIINDILDLEKISTGRMEFEQRRVDLSGLVLETNAANHMLHQRFAIDVSVSGAETPIHVVTDPNRIIQVLTNLISNACKFSKPGGRVSISVEDQGEQVRVAVTDQGAGIPFEDHHKIFQRFADLKNSDRAVKGGTGLGLSICKAIVESLAGTIGFKTKEGVGTTFYFVLPKTARLGSDEQREDDLRVAS